MVPNKLQPDSPTNYTLSTENQIKGEKYCAIHIMHDYNSSKTEKIKQ
jgi:hypothetical protein